MLIYIYMLIVYKWVKKSSFLSNPRSQKNWLLEVKIFDFQNCLPGTFLRSKKTGCQSKKLTSDFCFKKTYLPGS